MSKGKWIAAIALGLSIPISVHGFGGEDLLRGKPWHHNDITLRALTGKTEAGDTDPIYTPKVVFGAGAEAVAWHSEYIDSYLYSPVFMLSGFTESSITDRGRASLVGYNDLVNLHFDDVRAGGGVPATWERYASGTLAGLYWASEQGANGDVSAGHHILGVSLHAVQDFYSHSNWVTAPERRCFTYFQKPADERRKMYLLTGAYAQDASVFPEYHGGYSLSCSLLKLDYVDAVMKVACSSLLPLHNTTICRQYRECADSVPIEVSAGVKTTSLVRLDHPGIALDSTPYARAQAVNRGLTDMSGSFMPMKDGLHFPQERCKSIIASTNGPVCELDADKLFAGTKDVAIRASMEWVEWLEEAMYAIGKGDYWERLKASDPDTGSVNRIRQDIYPNRYGQFEDLSKLPYQFLATGPYPSNESLQPSREQAGESRGWYLRLQIKTSELTGSGTSADISAIVTIDGRDLIPIPLDYMPTDDRTGRVSHPLFVYDDFEMGAEDAYMIGPFQKRPEAIRLRNDAADYGDVIKAGTKDLITVTDTLLSGGRELFLSFMLGGNADFVGYDKHAFDYEELDRRLRSSGQFEYVYRVRSESEGSHDVRVIVRDHPQRRTQKEVDRNWRAVEFQLKTIETIKESDFDRLSESDEPFVIFRVDPHNGNKDPAYSYMSKPFDDMDDGDVESFPVSSAERFLAKIPPNGVIMTTLTVHESDSENLTARRELKATADTGLDESTRRASIEIDDAIAASLLEDWTANWIEIFAFERGTIPQAGLVLERTNIGDVPGDTDTRTFELDWSNQTSLIGPDVYPTRYFEAESPNAKYVLEGDWHSNKYWCGTDQPYQKVRVSVSGEDGNTVAALKTEAIGDKCVGQNEATFRGEFEDNVITGERYVVPPPYNRPKEVTDPPHPLDPIPDYFNTLVHRRLGLEGNWIISWSNSTEPPAKAVLTKGGTFSCAEGEGGGCWHQFERDPGAKWTLDYFQPGDTVTSTQVADSVEIDAAGNLRVDWNYFHLSGGGGVSASRATSDDSISGTWRVDPDLSGGETWTRAIPRVTSIALETDAGEASYAVGQPIQVSTDFRSHIDRLHANRDSFFLRIYGDHLWGRHYGHIPWSSDLEFAGFSYICARRDSRGGDTTTGWKDCLQRGGVRGLRAKINVWHRAESKRHVFFFNDIEIPIDLDVVDEPQRYPQWQNMKMELKSCSVLEEIDRPYDEHPFKLVRQDISPQ
jgi:hypothetical protein